MMISIRVRYLGPTNTQPSRLVADDGRGNRLVQTYALMQAIAEGSSRSPEEWLACRLADKMGWSRNKGFTGGVYKEDHYFNFND